MRTLAKVIVVVVLLAAGGLWYWKAKMTPRIPDRPLAAPTGSFGVGTTELEWVDSTRDERYTKDPADKRRVIVQIWYPIAPGTTGDTAKYILRPEGFASAEGAKAAAKARSNAIANAPAATSDSGFPLLLYNHGGGWTRWSATFAAQQLASHGYVVASVEHFGFNQTNKYFDGTAFTADTLTFPKESGDGRKDALASWEYLADPVFKFWTADARFALDRLEAMNRDAGPLQGRMDFSRVGAYGWSFGGALAVELTAVDPRVKVAVDHDGQLFGSVRETGTTRPVLLLHHGVDDAAGYPEKDQAVVRELMAMTESWDSTTREKSTADWYLVTIAGTDHGDFSDLSLFYPRDKTRLVPKRAHELINDYTLAFFDKYLRGKDAPILLDATRPAPEVTFRAWRRP